MTLQEFIALPGPEENPLDKLRTDGGFAGIFRTIGCIGDSLSSGEFESLDAQGKKSYHDFYEYSWGQYLARLTGSTVYNFSRGGMTAREYWESFAEKNDFWNPEKLCQAYIIALGANDLFWANPLVDLGTIGDFSLDDYEKNPPTFAGYLGKIMGRLRSMEPKCRFFLMSMPREENALWNQKVEAHAALLHQIAARCEHTYVLDFNRYAPVYDQAFRERFYLGGHMNPAGYLLTSRMVATYLDFIIRSHMEDFAQVGFIGKEYHNMGAKW